MENYAVLTKREKGFMPCFGELFVDIMLIEKNDKSKMQNQGDDIYMYFVYLIIRAFPEGHI